MQKFIKATLLSSATVLTLSGISTAQILDEITVTATKRTESVQDVPIAIDALDGSLLAELGVRDGDDVLKLYPNLNNKPTTNYNPGISIRGVGTNIIHISAQQSVGLYVDDITAVSPFVSQLSIYDLERVEIMRGPQNTLYGRNTTGGAVNYITKKAKIGAGTNGNIAVETGNGGRYGAQGAVGFDVNDDVAIRIAGNYETFDGFFTNLTDGSDYGGTESTAWRVNLTWEPTDRLSANFAYSFAERDSDFSSTVHIGIVDENGVASNACSAGRRVSQAFSRLNCWVPITDTQYENSPGLKAQELGGDVVRINPTATGGYLVNYTTSEDGTVWNVPGSNQNTTKFENLAAHITYDLDFAELTSITSYLETDLYALNTPDLHSFANPQEGHWETFSQEFRLTSIGDDSLRWLVGFFYMDETSDQDTWVIRTDNNVSPSVLIDVKYEAFSLYGQIDYDLTDRLTFTAGVRSTEDDLEGTRYRTVQRQVFSIYNVALYDPSSRDLSGVTPTHPAQSLSETSYKLGADYMLNDDAMVYVSYSTGFKGGAFDNRALSVTGDQPISPEYIDAYEIGFKSTLADGAIQLNGAAFSYQWEDQQLFEVVSGSPALVNVDETEVVGAELDIRWQPSDNLYIQGGIGLLNSEIKENANARLINPNTNAQLGNELQYTPEISANLLVHYSTRVGAGTLSFQPSMRYLGEQYLRLDNTASSLQGALTFVDFRVGYRFGEDEQHEFSVRGENLTEEKSVNTVFNAPGARGGYTLGSFERSITATFSTHF